MTNSVATSLSFLYSTLAGDSTLMGLVTGIYRSVAPAGSTADYVIVIPQAMPKTLNAYGVRVMTRGLYQVKVVGPYADYPNLNTAWDRIVTLIGLVRSVSGILACYLEQELYIGEVVAGVEWCNLGGLFRIEV